MTSYRLRGSVFILPCHDRSTIARAMTEVDFEPNNPAMKR